MSDDDSRASGAQVIPFRPRGRSVLPKSLPVGEVKVQYLIGMMYEHGCGVETDFREAAKWYTLAAEGGLAQARNSLGFMYLMGLGLARDVPRAAYWFRLAAMQGHSGAQTNLGVLYSSGQGVEKNELVALKWFREAAARGNLQAQELLARAYERGWYGLPRDPERAHYWLNKSRLSA